jgi:hypothetical protein
MSAHQLVIPVLVLFALVSSGDGATCGDASDDPPQAKAADRPPAVDSAELAALRKAAALKKKREDLEGLEKFVQALRDDVRAQLADPRVPIRQSLAQAQAARDQAKQVVEISEIVVVEYEQGLAPQEQQTLEGQVKLAHGESINAQNRLEWAEQMAKRKFIGQSDLFAARLAVEKMKFSEQLAETNLRSHKAFERPKKLKGLQDEVQRAKDDLAAKEDTLQRIRQRESRAESQVERYKESGSDGHILQLLGEACADQGRLAAMIAELAKRPAAPDNEVDAAGKATRQLESLRAEAAKLSASIKARLTDAVELAEHLQGRRALLRQQEDELRRARKALELMERDAADAPKEPSRAGNANPAAPG